MSSSINKVIILGHLGQDPEVRQFPNGGQVTSLRVATSETWKDKTTGERKEATEWHTVSVFGNDAEFVAQYGSKGRLVYVEGQLKTRKWQDKSGNDRYSTEIVVQWPRGTVQFPAMDGERDQKAQNKSGGRQQQAETTSTEHDFDDDIPF